jgi:hypothetical protein
MIRELHVYGSMTAVGQEAKRGAQHIGIGKELLHLAESRAMYHGCEQIAIISGIGVRGYYQKRGYELRGTYMMKDLTTATAWSDLYMILQIILVMTVVWEICEALCVLV